MFLLLLYLPENILPIWFAIRKVCNYNQIKKFSNSLLLCGLTFLTFDLGQRESKNEKFMQLHMYASDDSTARAQDKCLQVSIKQLLWCVCVYVCLPNIFWETRT